MAQFIQLSAFGILSCNSPPRSLIGGGSSKVDALSVSRFPAPRINHSGLIAVSEIVLSKTI